MNSLNIVHLTTIFLINLFFIKFTINNEIKVTKENPKHAIILLFS